MQSIRAVAWRAASLSARSARSFASSSRAAAAASHGHHENSHGHAASSHHDDHHHDDHHGDPNDNPKHAGYETVYQGSVGFGSAFWRRALLAVAAGYGIIRLDYSLTKGGDDEHPLGKMVAAASEAAAGLEVIGKETSEDLAIFLKRARDVAAFRQIEEKPMHRLRNPSAVFDPINKLAIPVGTQDIDLTDLQVKSEYEDPDLYNPTGPVMMNPPKNLIQIPWKI